MINPSHLINHFGEEVHITIIVIIIIFNMKIIVPIRNVADELRIFESINHPHLINHFGVEIHREEMLIFMEYCPEVKIDLNWLRLLER